MTYEKKYRIARAGLDHLERAFVDLKVAHEEMRNTYHQNIDFIFNKLKDEQTIRADWEIEAKMWKDLYEEARAKSWWQKLKETIKTKIR